MSVSIRPWQVCVRRILRVGSTLSSTSRPPPPPQPPPPPPPQAMWTWLSGWARRSGRTRSSELTGCCRPPWTWPTPGGLTSTTAPPPSGTSISRTASSSSGISGTNQVSPSPTLQPTLHYVKFYRSGLEVLVGSTIKKKWSKIKNRILKMNTETTEDYCWVPLIDEKTISITCLNIKMQSERWSNININKFLVKNVDSTLFFFFLLCISLLSCNFYILTYPSNPSCIKVKVDSAFRQEEVSNEWRTFEWSLLLSALKEE